MSIKVKTITSSSIEFEDTTNNNTSSQISPSTTTTSWKVGNKYDIYRNRLTKKYSIEIPWYYQLRIPFPLRILVIAVVVLIVFLFLLAIFSVFSERH